MNFQSGSMAALKGTGRLERLPKSFIKVIRGSVLELTIRRHPDHFCYKSVQ